jgi:hypothetical protein
MLQRMTVGEIFEKIGQCETKDGIVGLLRSYGNKYFQDFLVFMFDASVEPDFFGIPEFKQTSMPIGMSEGNLFLEARRLYVFDKNRNSHIKLMVKAKVLQAILSGLSKVDGDFFVALLKGEAAPKNLTPEIVNEVFPNLIVKVRNNGAHSEIQKVQPVSGTVGGDEPSMLRPNSKRKR